MEILAISRPYVVNLEDVVEQWLADESFHASIST
jgi:hypothetical protein